jgi:hypothetical protein
MQREKTELKNGPGAGRAAKNCGRLATVCPQKTMGFSPKFPCKSLNSLVPLILEIWKENFENKILEKGKS